MRDSSEADFKYMCDVAMHHNIREAYFFFVGEILRETGTRPLALNYGRDYEYWDNYVRQTAGQLLSEEYGIPGNLFMSFIGPDDCFVSWRVVDAIVRYVPGVAGWNYWQLLARWKVAERIKYNGYEYSDFMEEWFALDVCCDEADALQCSAIREEAGICSDDEQSMFAERLKAYIIGDGSGNNAQEDQFPDVGVLNHDELVGHIFAEIAQRYMDCTKNKDAAGRKEVRQSLRNIIDELKLHSFVPREVQRCIDHFDDKDAPVVPQITVMGDYIQEQQIAGGASFRKDGRKKSAQTARVTDQVFAYTFLEDEEGPLRLARLCQYLLKAEWLSADTKPDTFVDLFLGEAKSFTIKWTGRQQDLYYLIKRLSERQLIKCPKGATKWVILGSHVVDSRSRPFTDWNKQKDPKTSAAAIERLADLLDVNY